MAALTEEELQDGAFIEVEDWKGKVPLRRAPWFGVESSGKYRGISDMSAGPESVNDCTRRGQLPRTRLAKWDAVAGRIAYMKQQHPSRRIVMAKFDVRRAYRQCPIPLRDRWKAVHVFDGKTYAHTRLMIGAKISADMMSVGTTAVADVMAERHKAYVTTYIDDQLLIAYEDEFDDLRGKLIMLWREMGWPINEKKLATEGTPSTVKIFLGVELDSERGLAGVTADRRAKLIASMSEMLQSANQPTQKDASRLAGKLQFVARTTPHGRTFLHHLHKVADGADASPQLIGAREELRWWLWTLSNSEASASFLPPRPPALKQRAVASDATPRGWGAVLPQNLEYIAGTWPASHTRECSIAHFEAGAVVLAAAAWGPSVAGGVLRVLSDSMSTVIAFAKGSCTDTRLNYVLRYAAQVQLTYGFRIYVTHIRGEDNKLADAASRCRKPTPCNHWRKPRGQWRRWEPLLYGLLRWPKRSLPSRGATSSSLHEGTCSSTRSSGVSTTRSPLWIIWSQMPMAPIRTADWSTSPCGCATRA